MFMHAFPIFPFSGDYIMCVSTQEQPAPAGIHAAVMATCGPGTALLVARNCHLAALSALVLSGNPKAPCIHHHSGCRCLYAARRQSDLTLITSMHQLSQNQARCECCIS